MTFELLPHLGPWLVGFVVAALAGFLAGTAVVTESVVRNRRTRLAQQQSLRTYYREHLVLGH